MQLLNTLYVTLPDSYLRLDNDTLRVVDADGETRLRVPLHHLQSVVCFGHVSLSAGLMHRLAEDGKSLVLLTSNGRFKARLEGEVSGNVLLRRAQHRAVDDALLTLNLARSLVAGKLHNQRQTLLRGARETRDQAEAARLTRAAKKLAASLRALQGVTDLDSLRGVEGEAARTYFEAMNLIVKSVLRPSFRMDGRTRRPPRDRMNALISFLYSMWMNDCRSAVEAAGLDPQLGFLHTVRPGRASLALDLMEEFRPYADRLALTLINRGQLRAEDFAEREGGAVTLEEASRKVVVVAYQERKQEELNHPLLNEKVALGLVPLVQARLLARFIRREVPAYFPFPMR
jgi:CRISPR-associated protein Cas1